MARSRRKAKRRTPGRRASAGFWNWSGFILTAVIIISFFLPWICITVGKPLGVWKFKTSATDIDACLSGYQIPTAANEGIWSLFVPFAEASTGVSDLGRWSYLFFLFPVIGAICFLLLLIDKKRKWADLLVILLCGIISGAGLYKVSQAGINSVFVDVVIGPGLWLTLFSFLGFAVIGLIKLF